MPAATLPHLNALVDLVLPDGAVHRSRVEDVAGRTLTVAAPVGEPDAAHPGMLLTLAWLRARRRFAVPVRLDGPARARRSAVECWVVAVVADPGPADRRGYFRGGGGEAIRLTLRGERRPSVGELIDGSEAGIRCRVAGGGYRPGDRVDVALTLGDEVVEVAGLVLSVRRDVESGDDDLIATYETTEAVGRTIRAYFLRRQMEQRRQMIADG